MSLLDEDVDKEVWGREITPTAIYEGYHNKNPSLKVDMLMDLLFHFIFGKSITKKRGIRIQNNNNDDVIAEEINKGNVPVNSAATEDKGDQLGVVFSTTKSKKKSYGKIITEESSIDVPVSKTAAEDQSNDPDVEVAMKEVKTTTQKQNIIFQYLVSQAKLWVKYCVTELDDLLSSAGFGTPLCDLPGSIDRASPKCFITSLVAILSCIIYIFYWIVRRKKLSKWYRETRLLRQIERYGKVMDRNEHILKAFSDMLNKYRRIEMVNLNHIKRLKEEREEMKIRLEMGYEAHRTELAQKNSVQKTVKELRCKLGKQSNLIRDKQSEINYQTVEIVRLTEIYERQEEQLAEGKAILEEKNDMLEKLQKLTANGKQQLTGLRQENSHGKEEIQQLKDELYSAEAIRDNYRERIVRMEGKIAGYKKYKKEIEAKEEELRLQTESKKRSWAIRSLIPDASRFLLGLFMFTEDELENLA